MGLINGAASAAARFFARAAGYNIVTRSGDRVLRERKGEDELLPNSKRLEVIAANRDAARNTTFSPATSIQLRNNVIGTRGGRLTVIGANGKVDDAATRAFRKWARHAEFTRGTSLNELLGQLLHQLTHLGGDFIAVFDAGELTGARNPSLRVKIFEPDQIRNVKPEVFARVWGDGFSQSNGIVRDSYGRVCGAFVGAIGAGDEFGEGEFLVLSLPVAGDFTSGNWIHCAVLERPNVSRGISPVTHLADTVSDLEVLKDCELASAKANSALGLVFSESDNAASVDVNPFASGSGDSADAIAVAEAAARLAADAENAALKGAAVKLSSGQSAVVKLRPNTKLESFNTERPNLNSVEFYDRLQESSGTVLGLPQMYIHLKPQGSYSAARAEMSLARPTFEYWQKFLERNFLDWLATRVLVALGYDSATDGGFLWGWAATDEIDEGSHQTALQKAFLNGEINLVDLHGADTESFLDRRAAEAKMCRDRGIVPPWEVLPSGAIVETDNGRLTDE